MVPPVPVSLPVPPKGTHGCWLLSPVPEPVSLPAPIRVPVPVPVAEMLTMLPFCWVEAWPLYLPVKTTVLVDTAVAAVAPTRPATATARIEFRNFLTLDSSQNRCVLPPGARRDRLRLAAGPRV